MSDTPTEPPRRFGLTASEMRAALRKARSDDPGVRGAIPSRPASDLEPAGGNPTDVGSTPEQWQAYADDMVAPRHPALVEHERENPDHRVTQAPFCHTCGYRPGAAPDSPDRIAALVTDLRVHITRDSERPTCNVNRATLRELLDLIDAAPDSPDRAALWADVLGALEQAREHALTDETEAIYRLGETAARTLRNLPAPPPQRDRDETEPDRPRWSDLYGIDPSFTTERDEAATDLARLQATVADRDAEIERMRDLVDAADDVLGGTLRDRVAKWKAEIAEYELERDHLAEVLRAAFAEIGPLRAEVAECRRLLRLVEPPAPADDESELRRVNLAPVDESADDAWPPDPPVTVGNPWPRTGRTGGDDA